MIIDMRTWARAASPSARPQPTAPLSVLQSSINSLHQANESRKLKMSQAAAQGDEPDPVEPPDLAEPDDEDEDEASPGEIDDQADVGDPLNR